MTHSSDAPRHPRTFAGVAGRAARALTTAFSALALAIGALAVTPAPAQAYDPPTTQEYVSYYQLDSLRAQGYTGKGVTIALIDGPLDTNAAEIRGANVTDKSKCSIVATPRRYLARDRHGVRFGVPVFRGCTRRNAVCLSDLEHE